MQQPLEITFRNMDPSPAVEADVKQKAAKLDEFFDRIMACRVAIEKGHKHHRKGNLYHVRIDLTVPDGELVVNREPDAHHAHEDVYVAVRDAFDAMRRRLEDFSRQVRGDVKYHDLQPHGRVAYVAPMADYGTIVTTDGKEVYFHRNSIVDADFDRLEVGDEVRFTEEIGEQGPQATTVHVIGKHHAAG